MKTTTAVLLVTMVAAAPVARAQAPDRPAVTPAAIALGTRVGVPPSSYEEGRRRDPFASLLAGARRASDTPAGGRPIAGLAGVVLADITVRGTVKSGTTMLAILEGPNKRSFIARLNDRLRDASVQSIDASGVVFTEQFPSGVRPTNVRKTIRPAGEGIQ